MDRQGKLYQDEMTVEKYRQQLKEEKKPYGQVATARAANQRRARGLALGEAALKIMDSVKELGKGHRLVPMTLMYMMDEKVIYPIADVKVKQYEYDVMFQVQAEEREWTDEEVEQKCEDLTFRLAMETDEMFPEEEAADLVVSE